MANIRCLRSRIGIYAGWQNRALFSLCNKPKYTSYLAYNFCVKMCFQCRVERSIFSESDLLCDIGDETFKMGAFDNTNLIWHWYLYESEWHLISNILILITNTLRNTKNQHFIVFYFCASLSHFSLQKCFPACSVPAFSDCDLVVTLTEARDWFQMIVWWYYARHI